MCPKHKEVQQTKHWDVKEREGFIADKEAKGKSCVTAH